jgi:aminoglycoside phosphotransferase (APT) family kinase protein
MVTRAAEEKAPGVATAELHAWLAAALPDLPAGELSSRLITGGRSNLTYRLDGAAQPLVLRRPPAGQRAAAAHDVSREFRVMRALAGTPVPVPRVLALCTDTSVLGSPFYVMEYVEGMVLAAAGGGLGRLDPERGRILAYALVDTLADLHSVDPDAVGLGDFGRPGGFLARQLRRWTGQFETHGVRSLPGLAELTRWLESACPQTGRHALVHGDYRLDNVLVSHGDPGKIAAVLDWELATLGDPLADLGLLCVYWDGLAGLGDAVPLAPGASPGWPDSGELAQRYLRRCQPGAGRLDWYIAFAYVKVASILAGVRYRSLREPIASPGIDQIEDVIPVLIERALAVRER